jgi:hypothetical protein
MAQNHEANEKQGFEIVMHKVADTQVVLTETDLASASTDQISQKYIN